MTSRTQFRKAISHAHPALSEIDLMDATDFHPFDAEGWIFELKWNGYRILASKEQLLTRNRKDATGWYPEIASALQELRGSFVLDGEMCLLDENGLPDFEGIRARTASRRGGQPVTYFAFDLLWHNGKDLRTMPLIERKEELRRLIQSRHPRLVYVDYVEIVGEILYRLAVAHGMEGIVAKRSNSPYTGTRSLHWRKAKAVHYHADWERPLRQRPTTRE